MGRGVAAWLVAGIRRNRPRIKSHVTQRASRTEISTASSTIASLMKVSIATPRFLRGDKWHEARQIAGR
jgi:hypothetical protein